MGNISKEGRVVVSVVNMHRLPELRYATLGAENGPQYARLAPSEAGLELVVVRLKVENHTATSAIINVNEQGAELRDFSSEKYFPIEINERVEFVDSPSRCKGPLGSSPGVGERRHLCAKPGIHQRPI